MLQTSIKPQSDLGTLLQNEGAIVLSGSQCPVTVAEWEKLEEIATTIEYQPYPGGKKTKLDWAVPYEGSAKQYTDFHPDAPFIRELLGKKEFLQLYGDASGATLFHRSCHFLRMRKGHHIGKHPHPDNKITMVLHPKCTFQGGEYVDYYGSIGRRIVEIPPRSVLVSLGPISHEVLEVTAGERYTLPVFCKA